MKINNIKFDIIINRDSVKYKKKTSVYIALSTAKKNKLTCITTVLMNQK